MTEPERRQTGRTKRMVSDAVDCMLGDDGRWVTIIADRRNIEYVWKLVADELRIRGVKHKESKQLRSFLDARPDSLLRLLPADSSVRRHLETQRTRIFVDHAVQLSINDAEFVKYWNEGAYALLLRGLV
jgi:hypothetical protein